MQTADAKSSPPESVPPDGETPKSPRITRTQWRSGIAAWLGWAFDGLDMHLYTLVAVPFVAELLHVAKDAPAVGSYGSIIQGSFLLGWALGGAFFGRVGDRLGRSKTLSLTVLTYALFTGMSVFAQQWWHLLVFRFIAALGIGGEWAVGASLLSETWPRKWRPWVAAVLQSAVNLGSIGAAVANIILANAQPRYLFLVGVLPAILVFWIRRAVPETEEWREAKVRAHHHEPKIVDLFRGETRNLTFWVVMVCGISLTAHWAFLFWSQQHLRRLPEVLNWTAADQARLASAGLYTVIGASIAGNFFAGWLARVIGYRSAIVSMFLVYFFAMAGAYCVPRPHNELLWWFVLIGFCQGVFGLFTMYLPPLFPTLLRTTGAGFSYNVGRALAAFGTVFFGLFSTVGAQGHADHRHALLYASFLFIPAAFVSLALPKVRD